MSEFHEWGKWVRHDPDKLGAQSSWAMVMRGNIPAGYHNYRMTDERGCQIDMAVSLLAKYSEICANVFVLTYVHRWSRDRIADEYLSEIEGLGRRATRYDVKDRLLVAEGYVVGVINFLKC